MNRRTITMLVLTGCLLMAIPAMTTSVGAQTADEETTDEAFAFDATLDNETVTVSVTENDTAVENASVTVNETDAGTTDDSGTLQFDLDNRSAVEIGVTVDNTTQSTTYEVVDGELVAQDDDAETTEPAFGFDATLDTETVTVSVESNDTAVANATVAVNGTDVGPTDANGTLQFPLENRTAVEITVTVDETTQTTTYEVVDGELVTQESTEDAQEVPDEAADQVSTLQRLISAFRNGEFEKLGPVISEAAGGGPPANAGNGQGNAPDNASNGQGNAPDNAGNGQDNASDNDGNGQGNAPDNAGNGQDNASDNDGNGQGNAPDNAGNGQDNTSDNDGNGQDNAGNGQDNAGNGQDNAPDNTGNGQDRGGSNGNADSGGPNSNQGNGGSGDTGGQGSGQGAGGR